MSTLQTLPMRVADVDLATVNLVDPAWYADGPPHELFARMRAEAPVRWNPLPDGTGFWSVTRHEHVAAVSKTPAIFSSSKAGVFLHPDQILPLDLARNLLLYMDPPQHTKYRKILQTAFTPHTVRALEGSVRGRVTAILDDVIEAGQCDWVKEVAVPLPLGVLVSLMGLPEEDVEQLYHWSEGIEAAQRSPEPDAAAQVFTEMAVYLHQQIERQAQAGIEDSLVMRLRSAEVDGEQLTDAEILVFFGLLVFAGNDTTRNTAATGLNVLLDHPEQWRALCEQPSLIEDAVEEILRYTSVVQYFNRTATEDTELGGQSIKAGDRVIVWYTSASRDESVYDEPERFDIRRSKQDHKAFGGGGRHFCLGAGLARQELRVLLEEATRRMPGITRNGEIERVPSAWAHGLSSLPVAFPRGPREASMRRGDLTGSRLARNV